jgi:hypothetical protein
MATPDWFIGGGETWADVPGRWPYQVSTEGRVWSEHTEKVLSPYTDEQGEYLIVDLRDEGARTQRSVHTLVLEAHEGPPPDGHEAHHIDGDPKNNELDNLEYVDADENRDTAQPGEDDSFVTVEEDAPF